MVVKFLRTLSLPAPLSPSLSSSSPSLSLSLLASFLLYSVLQIITLSPSLLTVFICFYPSSDCEQSPGVYLREGGQNYSELRVPSAEKAAYYLDSAVNERSAQAHFLFTLHIYQYNVASKGAGKIHVLLLN